MDGTGAGLNAGDALTVSLEGLPYHTRWPRYAALTVAGGVVLVGLWLALARPVDPRRRISALEARRAQLLEDVRRLGTDALDDPRRAVLMDELEGVYAMLDAERARAAPANRTATDRAS